MLESVIILFFEKEVEVLFFLDSSFLARMLAIGSNRYYISFSSNF